MKKLLLSLITVVGVVGMVAASTQAVFSATSTIPGNTISTAKVVFTAHNFTGNKPIGVVSEKLVPGEWTQEGRAELYNQSDVSVKIYMYIDNLTGDACAKTNLKIYTGWAGGDEHVRTVLYNNVNDLVGAGNRREITGNPPFTAAGPNITQVIWQKAQLDDSADNFYQDKSCTWNEVFVAETVAE